MVYTSLLVTFILSLANLEKSRVHICKNKGLLGTEDIFYCALYFVHPFTISESYIFELDIS